MPKKQKLPPGISRVDDPISRLYGYVVRLHWSEGRPRFKKYFGDFSCGGRIKALAKAKKWRKVRV